MIVRHGEQLTANATVVAGVHTHVDVFENESETHHWIECRDCAGVVGDSLHAINFAPADCYKPETCSCGRTRGEITHSFVADPDYCNASCEHCGQVNTKEARVEHYDDDNNKFCDACGTSMLLLSDRDRMLILVAIAIGCLLIITAIFILFKSIKNRYGSIAGIMKKY